MVENVEPKTTSVIPCSYYFESYYCRLKTRLCRWVGIACTVHTDKYTPYFLPEKISIIKRNNIVFDIVRILFVATP